ILFLLLRRLPLAPTLFPYTTLFRSGSSPPPPRARPAASTAAARGCRGARPAPRERATAARDIAAAAPPVSRAAGCETDPRPSARARERRRTTRRPAARPVSRPRLQLVQRGDHLQVFQRLLVLHHRHVLEQVEALRDHDLVAA